MQQQPEFVFFGKMSFGARLVCIAILAFAGVAIQAFVSVLFGWVLVLLATLMAIVKGRSNAPKLTTSGEWQNVTTDELTRACELLSKGKSVEARTAAFSLASCSGCALGLTMLAGIAVAAVCLHQTVDQGVQESFEPFARGGAIASVFAMDALTLLLPLWLFGRVSTWEPPDLRTRLCQVVHIYNVNRGDPTIDWQPSLNIATSAKGTVPTDCKLMAKIKDSDQSFMGIQVQTSLNDVQGKKYRYTYCVLIARPEFKLLEKAKQIVDMPPRGGFQVGFLGLFADTNEKKEAKFARYRGTVVELKSQDDVEIAVVRQPTGGQGYTTSNEGANRVFQVALALAKAVLAG